MNPKKTNQVNLDSVLLDFRVEAAGGPNAAILERYCKEHPQYARDLTEYAVQWLIGDALASAEQAGQAAPAVTSPLVSRAISRFHDCVSAHRKAAERTSRETCNPFGGLSVARKREIRDELRINTPLFAKFENRLIDPDTIPRGFLDRLARLVQSGLDDLVGYLRLRPAMQAACEFKAEGKPAAAAHKESFQDAVRGSSLDEKQKQALLEG